MQKVEILNANRRWLSYNYRESLQKAEGYHRREHRGPRVSVESPNVGEATPRRYARSGNREAPSEKGTRKESSKKPLFRRIGKCEPSMT
jgi:hypothetical protein